MIVKDGAGRNFCISISQTGRALSLAVGDARRDVPIAHQHQPAVKPALKVGGSFVAIGDVQQLHDVGAVLAPPLQRARNFLPDRRAIVGKRHQARLPPLLFQTIAQQLGLRLLPALIQPFECDQMSHMNRSGG